MMWLVTEDYMFNWRTRRYVRWDCSKHWKGNYRGPFQWGKS